MKTNWNQLIEALERNQIEFDEEVNEIWIYAKCKNAKISKEIARDFGVEMNLYLPGEYFIKKLD